MKRGILLCALGHENYYRMAVLLAASIRVNDSLPVCLVTDAAVKKEHAHLFYLVKVPVANSITNKGKKEFIKAKLFLYDYSPFEETIFLDVDQILIPGRRLTPVFDELKKVDITISNAGPAGSSIWADIKETQAIYGNKPFWNFHSEFIYFKKCKRAKDYFQAAKKVYREDKIKSATRFANATMADELAFQCAAIITGTYPHKENWLPNFWYDRNHREINKYPYQLGEQYVTYSIGGKVTPVVVRNHYNNLARFYFAKLGLLCPYQVADKRSYLPERKAF